MKTAISVAAALATAALATAGCAHLDGLSDREVINIAGRALKTDKLAEDMKCSVQTDARTWLVNCQMRGQNVLDGGVYVTIDRHTRRVVSIRHDA